MVVFAGRALGGEDESRRLSAVVAAIGGSAKLVLFSERTDDLSRESWRSGRHAHAGLLAIDCASATRHESPSSHSLGARSAEARVSPSPKAEAWRTIRWCNRARCSGRQRAGKARLLSGTVYISTSTCTVCNFTSQIISVFGTLSHTAGACRREQCNLPTHRRPFLSASWGASTDQACFSADLRVGPLCCDRIKYEDGVSFHRSAPSRAVQICEYVVERAHSLHLRDMALQVSYGPVNQ